MLTGLITCLATYPDSRIFHYVFNSDLMIDEGALAAVGHCVLRASAHAWLSQFGNPRSATETEGAGEDVLGLDIGAPPTVYGTLKQLSDSFKTAYPDQNLAANSRMEASRRMVRPMPAPRSLEWRCAMLTLGRVCAWATPARVAAGATERRLDGGRRERGAGRAQLLDLRGVCQGAVGRHPGSAVGRPPFAELCRRIASFSPPCTAIAR